MEYVQGKTLRQMLREGRPGILEAIDIVTATGRALQTAHGQGIIHRRKCRAPPVPPATAFRAATSADV